MSHQHPESESAPGPDGQQPPSTGPAPVYGPRQRSYGQAPPPPPYAASQFTSPSGSPVQSSAQQSSPQSYSGQPDSGQPDSGQPDPGQPNPGRSYSGQPNPGQPYPAQPYAARPDADSQPVGAYGYGAQQAYGQQPLALGHSWPQAWAVRPRFDYASWGRRVVALLIDRVVAIAASVVLMVAYIQGLVIITQQGSNGFTAPDFSPILLPVIIGSALSLAGLGWDVYNRWIVGGRTGQSLGKRVMKISLVSEQTGDPIGALNAFCRDLVHILDGFAYVGFLWPLWDDKRQTFADMLMKTVVLNAGDKPSRAATH